VVRTLLSPSSYISGLLSDSDEDIIQKKEDVAKPQMLVSNVSDNLQVDIRIFAATL
jgi:hypothetical protein